MTSPADRRVRALRWAVWGTVAVWVYATLAALHVLVWNPLATAPPGRTLAQVHDDLAAAGESLRTSFVLGILAIGPIAAVLLLVLVARGRIGPRSARMIVLGLVALGSPGLLIVSFPAGMALADTYATGGGDHAPWGLVLRIISGFAFIAWAVLVAARTRRRPRK